jgi:hypothetical protein
VFGAVGVAVLPAVREAGHGAKTVVQAS